MKRAITTVFVGLAMLLLSGCILFPAPHEEWLSPRFTGSVVDDETGQPLADAKVTLHGYHWRENEIGPVVSYSDQNGRYVALATRHTNWFPLWLGPAEGPQGGIVRVEHGGYVAQEVKKEVFTGAMSRIRFEVDVRLKKEPNQALEPTPPSRRGSP